MSTLIERLKAEMYDVPQSTAKVMQEAIVALSAQPAEPKRCECHPVIVAAQHGSTGRSWSGPLCELPPGYSALCGGHQYAAPPAAEPKDEQVERLTRSLRNRYGKNLSEDDDAWKAADLIESQARQIATLTAERDRATKLYEDGMHGYERVCCERDRAVEALLYLDKQGGLGFEKHLLIKKAIGGIPYPEFCHHADKCRGLSNCPRDPCCCD